MPSSYMVDPVDDRDSSPMVGNNHTSDESDDDKEVFPEMEEELRQFSTRPSRRQDDMLEERDF
jgi:hypothetical protein